MRKLEKLTQEESGSFHQADGTVIDSRYLTLMGRIITLVQPNPGRDISKFVDEMTKEDSIFIPGGANAYVVSDFSGTAQRLIKNYLDGEKKFCSVYAIQFYHLHNLSLN